MFELVIRNISGLSKSVNMQHAGGLKIAVGIVMFVVVPRPGLEPGPFRL